MKLLIKVILIFILFLTNCKSRNINENILKQQIEIYKHIFNEYKIERVFENPDSIYLNRIYDLGGNFVFNKKDTSKIYATKESIVKYWKSIAKIINSKEKKYFDNHFEAISETNAYHRLSFPVFNEQKNQAIINITFDCGRYCSYERTCSYEKVSNEWKLKTILWQATW